MDTRSLKRFGSTGKGKFFLWAVLTWQTMSPLSGQLPSKIDTISIESVLQGPALRPDASYRIFRTDNIFTFLELDTRNGRIWQIHWSSEGGRSVGVPLNEKSLATSHTPGRFTLYATQNIYNFILLDQDEGNAWRVQWSYDENKRSFAVIANFTIPDSK